jgi:hypothetical protein
MAQLSVSWFICRGRLRVHAINAVGRRSGRIIEIEDTDTGERIHGSPISLMDAQADWRQPSLDRDAAGTVRTCLC